MAYPDDEEVDPANDPGIPEQQPYEGDSAGVIPEPSTKNNDEVAQAAAPQDWAARQKGVSGALQGAEDTVIDKVKPYLTPTEGDREIGSAVSNIASGMGDRMIAGAKQTLDTVLSIPQYLKALKELFHTDNVLDRPMGQLLQQAMNEPAQVEDWNGVANVGPQQTAQAPPPPMRDQGGATGQPSARGLQPWSVANYRAPQGTATAGGPDQMAGAYPDGSQPRYNDGTPTNPPDMAERRNPIFSGIRNEPRVGLYQEEHSQRRGGESHAASDLGQYERQRQLRYERTGQYNEGPKPNMVGEGPGGVPNIPPGLMRQAQILHPYASQGKDRLKWVADTMAARAKQENILQSRVQPAQISAGARRDVAETSGRYGVERARTTGEYGLKKGEHHEEQANVRGDQRNRTHIEGALISQQGQNDRNDKNNQGRAMGNLLNNAPGLLKDTTGNKLEDAMKRINRAREQSAPQGQAPAQGQQAPKPQAKLVNGKWYIRGPKGEAIEVRGPAQ